MGGPWKLGVSASRLSQAQGCSLASPLSPARYLLTRQTRSHPDHWDHGLMLTGLDLYDGSPKQNSVIGLAWVSGMCHPEYSCTINEGNNFESVYVIAHEMGHNLGMNHDGETSSGNTCDPNTNLMSPVLGPGKVTWSSCSNQEINNFLSNRFQKISQFLPKVSDKRAGS